MNVELHIITYIYAVFRKGVLLSNSFDRIFLHTKTLNNKNWGNLAGRGLFLRRAYRAAKVLHLYTENNNTLIDG